MTDDDSTIPNDGERLQRILASAGVASRRKSEELIRSGRVSVDGKVVTKLGSKFDPQAVTIRVDGRVIRVRPFRYVIVNKPSGLITTTSDERGRRTVMELVSGPERLYPVGRLDRKTEGLLLFTNDGEVANRVMHPRYGLAKEYEILTPQKPSDRAMQRVRAGTELDGKVVMPEEFRIVRETVDGTLLTIVVHEGLNRVVRRIMEAAEIPVERLRRTRVGPLSLAGIPRGAHRDLSEGEVQSLLQAVDLQRDRERSPAPRPASRDERTSTAAPQGFNRGSKRRPGVG
jgi:23S rRNA pseudouridine2605 synthase